MHSSDVPKMKNVYTFVLCVCVYVCICVFTAILLEIFNAWDFATKKNSTFIKKFLPSFKLYVFSLSSGFIFNSFKNNVKSNPTSFTFFSNSIFLYTTVTILEEELLFLN